MSGIVNTSFLSLRLFLKRYDCEGKEGESKDGQKYGNDNPILQGLTSIC